MALTNAQVTEILYERLPAVVADEFVLPIIEFQGATFESEGQLLRYQPTPNPVSKIEFLASLNWQLITLNVRDVGVGLNLWSMRDQRDYLNPAVVASCSERYEQNGSLNPPILMDSPQEAPRRYTVLDGNHRFMALSKMKIREHPFWVGSAP